MTTRRALGRGLGALIPGVKPQSVAPTATSDAASGLVELKVTEIDPNPDQPRRRFEPEQLEQLAGSLRLHGVLQPIVVRHAGERFELLVGERRWRASQMAGLETIPAVIADVAPRDRLEIALVENVQRRDLNPIELALAFRALADAGSTHDAIGTRVGMDRSSVSNHLRLLELPRDIQQEVENGRLTIGHAKALLQVSHPEQKRRLCQRILAEELSVRETEALSRRWGERGESSKTRASTPQDPQVQALLDALRDNLKTRIRLHGSPRRGRIEIDYFGPEDLRRIVQRILDGQ